MTGQQYLARGLGELAVSGRSNARARVESLHDRQLCRCVCDLVKPSQRLQRLFHTSVAASLSRSAKGLDSAGLELGQDHVAELKLLVKLLPKHLREILHSQPRFAQLLEVVLDLGRPPYARFPDGDFRLSNDLVTQANLDAAVAQIGEFGDDNRAGIDRTLHRISCIRNRDGAIVGLTCRAGRAVTGSAALAADLATSGKSILILGRPGVGKTTAIRELSRLLADECKKRVVIVDTSNEIGGDGDIPHSGVGFSRRMQVAHTEEQHRVMIEAVENHMPEVIVIDEIGTESEALAARTIAQRGVQLIATAHGGHLENIMKNPSLLDLLGGIQSVTLGDDEARRRGGRKTVRERAAPPTFDVAVELLDRRKWCIYPDIAAAVDCLLLGQEPPAELREQDSSGTLQRSAGRVIDVWPDANEIEASQRPAFGSFHPSSAMNSNRSLQAHPGSEEVESVEQQAEADRIVQPLFVFSVGLDNDRVCDALHALGQRGERLILTSKLEAADVVLAVRSQMKMGSWARDAAKAAGVPVYAVKNGSASHLVRALETLLGLQPSAGSLFESDVGDDEPVQYQNHVVSMSAAHNEAEALKEVQEAMEKVVLPTMKPIELLPRSEVIVYKQAAMVEGMVGVATQVIGNGLQSRLRIIPQPTKQSSTDSGHASTLTL